MTKEQDIENLLRKIKSNVIELDKMKIQNDEDYAINFLNWVKEITEKNKVIYQNKSKKDHETYKKERSHVFWIDFGKNIGSEFNNWHFAVVIRESHFTALVVPISTEKDETPDWKIKEDLIIPIGEIDLPEERRPSYAMIHQMQVVSKKRLSLYGSKSEGFHKIKLTTDQMNLIDGAIEEHLIKNKSKVLQKIE